MTRLRKGRRRVRADNGVDPDPILVDDVDEFIKEAEDASSPLVELPG